MIYKFLKTKLRHPEDCVRIATVAMIYGYYITPTEAQELWEDHSNDMAAGWLFLPSDDIDLWMDIRGYFIE